MFFNVFHILIFFSLFFSFLSISWFFMLHAGWKNGARPKPQPWPCEVWASSEAKRKACNSKRKAWPSHEDHKGKFTSHKYHKHEHNSKIYSMTKPKTKPKDSRQVLVLIHWFVLIHGFCRPEHGDDDTAVEALRIERSVSWVFRDLAIQGTDYLPLPRPYRKRRGRGAKMTAI